MLFAKDVCEVGTPKVALILICGGGDTALLLEFIFTGVYIRGDPTLLLAFSRLLYEFYLSLKYPLLLLY